MGGFFKGIISVADPKKCGIKIIEEKKEYGKRDYYLRIAIAPTKNIERFEWFLEKATEIGIDEITPLICRHSERKEVKPERLKKVLLSAMKQSLKAYLPKLNDAISFEKFMRPHSQPLSKEEWSVAFICQINAGRESLLKDVGKNGKHIVILIGPEGDFSEEEMEKAKKQNFVPVCLGDSRLRTETAGVVAATIINMLNQ